MRDLAFALVILAVFPLAFARPFNAYLLWGWTGMLAPTAYFYGFMAEARINLVMALTTIGLVLLGRVKWIDYQKNRVSWWYLIFALHATIAFLFGYKNNPFNAHYYDILVKGLVFCMFMPFFVRDRIHFHSILIVIVLGLGIHGALNGLKTLVSAGGHNMEGPVGTMISDRNHLSISLAMVLPIIYYLHAYTERRWVRLVLLGGFCTVVLAILGGGSRAGFVTLAVVGLWLILTSPKKRLALLLFGLAAILFWAYAPQEWTSRLSTISDAEEDASFMGRMIAWQISSAIGLAHPIFGGGFHAVQIQSVWDAFKATPGLLGFMNLPVPEFFPKAAHSIYFELLGDMGFVGLFFFLCILAQAFFSRLSIARMAKQLGQSFRWAHDMANMLLLSVLAFMVGGATVSLSYFEMIYMIIMLLELLRVHVKRCLHDQAARLL